MVIGSRSHLRSPSVCRIDHIENWNTKIIYLDHIASCNKGYLIIKQTFRLSQMLLSHIRHSIRLQMIDSLSVNYIVLLTNASQINEIMRIKLIRSDSLRSDLFSVKLIFIHTKHFFYLGLFINDRRGGVGRWFGKRDKGWGIKTKNHLMFFVWNFENSRKFFWK